MKKYFFFLCYVCFWLTSCEEVIELDLGTQEKQLVVDASIDWKKGETKAFPIVRLSYTKDFYSNLPSAKVSGAIIKISTYQGEEYLLEEVKPEEIRDFITDPDFELPLSLGGSIYLCKSDFIPVLDRDYVLNIELNGEKYIAKARMRKTPAINIEKTQQIEDGGILGNKLEVKFFFDGFANEENNYLIKIRNGNRDNYLTLDDRFVANKKFFFTTLGNSEDIKKASTLNINLYRISAEYKQIIDLLINASVNENGGGRPDFSIPSRVFGNVVHQSNPKKNPLGAFRVSQYSKTEYVVK